MTVSFSSTPISATNKVQCLQISRRLIIIRDMRKELSLD